MKAIRIPQIEYISGSTPAESAVLFNEAMMKLAQYNPTFERTGADFYIYYQVVKEEVEEEKKPTKKACCLDCIYLSRDLNRFGEVDKRKKWAVCKYTGIRTNIESRACEIYYKHGRREEDEE